VSVKSFRDGSQLPAIYSSTPEELLMLFGYSLWLRRNTELRCKHGSAVVYSGVYGHT